MHLRKRGTFGGRERHFLLGGGAERERKGPCAVGQSSLRFSHSAVCHVDIPKLNSFYWVQFLASLTSKNVRISLIFY